MDRFQSWGMANRLGALCAILVLATVACNDDRQQVVEITRLAKEKKDLVCEMERLKQKNDSLWNEVAIALDKELPDEMKPDERSNMIDIKNAGLISMFQVFPKLDTAIQNKVHMAGEMDEKIATAMKSVMQQLAPTEQKLDSALEILEGKNKNEFKRIKQQLLEQEQMPCNK